MYIKINAKNSSITLCKLIFKNSNKNMLDYNWVYNNTNNYKYHDCDCSDISHCRSKNKVEIFKEIENKNKNVSLLKQINNNITLLKQINNHH
jgi:hypothetical protein